MSFRRFAYLNVMRNKRLYIAYFLSSMFTVMVFFTFLLFAFHPAFTGINPNVITGILTAGAIIYVFSFFYILYSMSSFLQSRKREFGLLMMLGASNRQIKAMVFFENIIIGVFSTIGGISLGLLFAKAILLVAENVLIIEESLYFYFPIQAILITLASFTLLFLFISLFVAFILRTTKLVDLLKGNVRSKGEPKSNWILSLLAAILLITGYIIALMVRGTEVVIALVPVVIIVMIGTYFFYTQLSVYVVRLLKKNRFIFWRKTNLLLFSDLSYRLKDNARTFFMVAMISTVAFSAIGSLFGFHSFITKGVNDSSPYAMNYLPHRGDEPEAVSQDIENINTLFADEGLDVEHEVVDLAYVNIGSDDAVISVIRSSDFNRLAHLIDAELVTPTTEEAIVIEPTDVLISDGSRVSKRLLNETVSTSTGEVIQATSAMGSPVIDSPNGAFVVHDDVFRTLENIEWTEKNAMWMLGDLSTETVVRLGEELEEIANQRMYFPDYTIFQIEKGYGPILFIGLFIGLVFFVSAGSFLYFRVFTDFDQEKLKFKAITKIGLTESELKQVVTQQLAILFFSPIVVALVHGAVALTALSHFFDYNLLMESTLVLASFGMIQLIYFLMARHFYLKQIMRIL